MDFLYGFMNQHKPSVTNNVVEFWEERTNSLDENEVPEYEEEVEHQIENNIEYEDTTSTGQRRSYSNTKIIKSSVTDDIIGSVIEHLLSEVKSRDKDNPEWSFFRSLMPDVSKLSAKRRRKFKEITLTTLNKLMEEEEMENSDLV